MSNQQQALMMETIAAIRKTLKRKAYDSDSDSSVEYGTNRGHKLKRRARFVRQGHLGSASGPVAYKEIADLAGYQRAIIHRNPPLVDEDGYDLESDDDDQHVQEVEAAAAEENPYSSVHLEQILAPLTSVTDLPTHPTLSRPFTSPALDELADQGCILMHKENRVLRKVKPLLTKLHGDYTWIPCGVLVGSNDQDFFTDTERFLLPSADESSKASAAPSIVNGGGQGKLTEGSAANHDGDETLEPSAGDAADEPTEDSASGKLGGGREPGESKSEPPAENGDGGSDVAQPRAKSEGERGPKAKANGTAPGKDAKKEEKRGPGKGKQSAAGSGEADVEMAEPSAPHESPKNPSSADAPNPEQNGSMVLSAVGLAETIDNLFIHPMFVTPESVRPDRDLGLPEQESEDIRRLLQLYVQKQEEICRGTKRLYDGLLKADRYRKTVLKWAKAEAHCGPNRDMSDGEDWYDKEEWGLADDLKKGQDEEEEDTAQTQKKTRNRR